MSSIQALSPALSEKIAAGEVIERPASVVRELVENAIDAGATKINIQIEEGGKKLIRVQDNGSGMDPQDLSLAFLSHATSKISQEKDLYNIQTLGFRGEALPSIAAVADVRAISREEGADAHMIEIIRGQKSTPRPHGAPGGTTLEVRNLFSHIPARRKFLKRPQTETGHVIETLTKLTLAWPEIHFTLGNTQKTLYDLAGTNDIRERLKGFFGTELAEMLIYCESNAEGVQLTSYISPASSPSWQYQDAISVFKPSTHS